MIPKCLIQLDNKLKSLIKFYGDKPKIVSAFWHNLFHNVDSFLGITLFSWLSIAYITIACIICNFPNSFFSVIICIFNIILLFIDFLLGAYWLVLHNTNISDISTDTTKHIHVRFYTLLGVLFIISFLYVGLDVMDVVMIIGFFASAILVMAFCLIMILVSILKYLF